MCNLKRGWSEGREENPLGVTRQRNHIRLRDSPERKPVGGQDSPCGEYRCALQLNQKGLFYVLTHSTTAKCSGVGNVPSFFVLLVMCFVAKSSHLPPLSI